MWACGLKFSLSPASQMSKTILRVGAVENLLKRIQEVYMLLLDLNYKVPFEPLVFTPGEIEERISLGDPFIKEVTSRGRVIYEK